MARTQSAHLTAQIRQGHHLEALGQVLQEAELEATGRRQVQAAESARAHRQAAIADQGSVGYFVAGVSADVVLERRRRSAVVVGERTQLPVVAANQVACPNVVLRSALFGIRQRGRTAGAVLRESIATAGDTEILFSGFRLGQKDLTVWLHCLDLARDGLEQTFSTSVYALNQRMGLADSSSNKDALLDCLGRLGLATVAVRSTTDELMIENRLLTYHCYQEGGVHRLRIKVDPAWAQLFGVARWTKLAVDVRVKLQGKELAQWLSSVLMSHNGKVPLKLDSLHRLSGSSASLREFRRMLNQALADCRAAGVKVSCRIE